MKEYTTLFEIPFPDIEGAYGGNQYWYRFLTEPHRNRGGCSTVCACEAAICLSRKYPSLKGLSPFSECTPTKDEFLEFGREMFRYIYPRERGLSKLSLFVDGFHEFAASRGCRVDIKTLSGFEDEEKAALFFLSCIRKGLPVQFLLLHHKDDFFEDYEWHWFNLTGSFFRNGELWAVIGTWGERRELPFLRLWHTGSSERGGMLFIDRCPEDSTL